MSSGSLKNIENPAGLVHNTHIATDTLSVHVFFYSSRKNLFINYFSPLRHILGPLYFPKILRKCAYGAHTTHKHALTNTQYSRIA